MEFQLTTAPGSPEDCWGQLLLEQEGKNPFYQRKVLEMAADLPERFRPRQFIEAWEDGKLLFFLPLAEIFQPQRRVLHLYSMPGSDYTEPLFDREREADIFRAFGSFLQRLQPRLILGRNLTEYFLERLADYFSPEAMQTEGPFTIPVMELSETIEEMMKRYKSRFRTELRRRRKRAIEAGLSFRILRASDMPGGYDTDAALDNLSQLHGRRWEHKGAGSSYFLEPAHQQFHRRLCRLELPQQDILFSEVCQGERVVGSMYGLMMPHRYVFIAQGFDPDYAKLSLGNLLVYHTLDEVIIPAGVQVFDFKRGEEGFKKAWTDTHETTRHLYLPLNWRGKVTLHGIRWRDQNRRKGPLRGTRVFLKNLIRDGF